MWTDDIKLDEEVLYIKLRRHSWRALEAKGSERDFPLFDASIWVHKHVILSFINKSVEARGQTLLNKTDQRYLGMARALRSSGSGFIPLLYTLVEGKNIKNPPKKQYNKAGYPKISKKH